MVILFARRRDMDIERLFRNCAVCMRFNNCRKYSFCPDCWKRVVPNEYAKKPRVLDTGIKLISLLETGKESEKIIYSIKQGKNLPTIEWLAAELAIKIQQMCMPKETIIVPIPPSRAQENDHAYFLSLYLSKYLGFALRQPLVWEDKKKEQKKKTKEERKHIVLHLLDKTLDQKGSTILLIDDMATTGSTLRAAQSAFKSPINFYAAVVCCKL